MNPWLGSRASWCISWNTERCVMCSEAVCLVLLSAPLIFHTHCHPLLTVSVLASYWYITSQRKARPADVFCYSLSSTSCTSISFHHHFSSVGCRVGSFNSNKEQRKKSFYVDFDFISFLLLIIFFLSLLHLPFLLQCVSQSTLRNHKNRLCSVSVGSVSGLNCEFWRYRFMF